MGSFEGEWANNIGNYAGKEVLNCLEGHLMPDPIHMCLSVPPKFSIAFVIGFLKGKSAVQIDREVLKTDA